MMHGLEISLPQDQVLSNDESFMLCQANRELKFERNKDGKVIVILR